MKYTGVGFEIYIWFKRLPVSTKTHCQRRIGVWLGFVVCHSITTHFSEDF
jgi:hypothetical protein